MKSKNTFPVTMERKLKTTNLANLCSSESNPPIKSVTEGQRVLLIDEVSSRVRLAKVSVYRAVADRRKGIDNSFPLPISRPGGKLRWLSIDIENYLQSRPPPPEPLSQPPVTTPVNRSKKQTAKSFRDRQEAARQTLKRHGIHN